MRKLPFVAVLFIAMLGGSVDSRGQTRDEKVRNDRKKVEAEGFWIYNNLPKGFEESRRTGKPIIVVFRCIPCEECVKLDDDLIDQDQRIKPLLSQFVCVRQVSTNNLDLSLFQFDTDQSFTVFFLNADKTVYGRFGTRSHRTEWVGDVSIEGLARAMEGALELHRGYPANKPALAAKTGPAPEFPVPEKFPILEGKYGASLDYEGAVAKSCIHCHQIGDARRDYYRAQGQPIPESVFFSYPHPKTIGLILDPDTRATVKSVESGTPAAKAGFQSDDVILKLNGQPLLSIADVQWVLQHTPAAGGSVSAEVKRGDKTVALTVTLESGWRSHEDVSWRASTWGMRRMGSGGLVLVSVPDKDRTKLGLEPKQNGLLVKYVGKFGPHAAAKMAGFETGDVLIAFDGHTDFSRETDLLAHAVTKRKAGQSVPVTVLRAGKKVELMLPLQN